MALKLKLKPVTEAEAKAAAQKSSPDALGAHVTALLNDLVNEWALGTDAVVMGYAGEITRESGETVDVGISWDQLIEDWKALTDAVESDSRGRGGKDAPKGIPTIVRKINQMHSASAESTFGLNARYQDADGRYPAKADGNPKDGFLLIGRADMFRTRIVKKGDAADDSAE